MVAEQDNRFVLYRHIRPDTNQPFYIGIGTARRPYRTGDRTKHWHNIYNLNNKKIDIDILFEDLTWEEACEKEKWWIAYYGRKDKGLGLLINLTDGGEGAYGRVKTPETIDKYKETMSTREHGMKGKTHTPEVRARIAEGARNKVWTPEAIEAVRTKNKGQKRTPEQIENSRIARTGLVWSEERKAHYKEARANLPKQEYSPERCKQISERLKGHTMSEQGRQRISEANKTRVVSQETRDKRSKALKGKNIVGKSVINTETGIVYISAQEALKISGYTVNQFYRRLSGTKVDNTFTYKYIENADIKRI